ncbi:MAG: 16S rRNA (guanine(527)-N(7))-methyltransferase RsmG [Rubrivivax sp.]|nr:16S rRNA (guanine(527)-N(7))-methyltransferase RsmG [Rubrivivax sp.]
MQRPDATQLAAGAATLGCPLTPSQTAQLQAYLALLARWNKVYNLTAVREQPEMVTLHGLDSLAVVPALERHAAGRALRLLDVGSGGGLPGAVIAIARPEWSVCCVDAVAKKARFVQQAALEIGLQRLRAEHARAQQLPPQQADVVISRALGSLADFTAWTHQHLASGGVWLAMKGRVPDDEMAALPPTVEVFHVEQLPVPGLDAARCAVWMRPKT